MEPGLIGNLKGLIETIEQKSGLNPLLFLNATVGLPSLVLYAFSGKIILIVLTFMVLIFTIGMYALIYTHNPDFLRSEKHVKEMRQLEILGEKGSTMNEVEVMQLPSNADTHAIAEPQPEASTETKK